MLGAQAVSPAALTAFWCWIVVGCRERRWIPDTCQSNPGKGSLVIRSPQKLGEWMGYFEKAPFITPGEQRSPRLSVSLLCLPRAQEHTQPWGSTSHAGLQD